MENEKREINRRVALALGMAITLFDTDGVTKVGEMWAYEKRILGLGTWYDLPDFCTDPAAADLVRQEIERRGWELIQRALIRPKLYDATIVHLGVPADEQHHKTSGGADLNSPHMALCLAFLAACEPTAEEGGEG